jgi:hypothetical protein
MLFIAIPIVIVCFVLIGRRYKNNPNSNRLSKIILNGSLVALLVQVLSICVAAKITSDFNKAGGECNLTPGRVPVSIISAIGLIIILSLIVYSFRQKSSRLATVLVGVVCLFMAFFAFMVLPWGLCF